MNLPLGDRTLMKFVIHQRRLARKRRQASKLGKPEIYRRELEELRIID